MYRIGIKNKDVIHIIKKPNIGLRTLKKVTKHVSPGFCRSCKVNLVNFFADAGKSCNSVQPGFFCVNNADFSPNAMCLYLNIRHEMD